MKEPNVAMTEAIAIMLSALPESSLRTLRRSIDYQIEEYETFRKMEENAITIEPYNPNVCRGKIPIIKALRIATGMGLTQAMDILENGGTVIVAPGEARDALLATLGK